MCCLSLPECCWLPHRGLEATLANHSSQTEQVTGSPSQFWERNRVGPYVSSRCWRPDRRTGDTKTALLLGDMAASLQVGEREQSCSGLALWSLCCHLAETWEHSHSVPTACLIAHRGFPSQTDCTNLWNLKANSASWSKVFKKPAVKRREDNTKGL